MDANLPSISLCRIGVDVGGTNTDAAILDILSPNSANRGVLASYKAATTPDITSGIETAIRAVLENSRVDQQRVLSVTIGTTHYINALIEADARRLDRVAVVRLCGPFTRQIPPFSGFPLGLSRILDGGVYYLDGGLEMDGRQIAPLQEDQVRQTARDIAASGATAVAVVGVFSPLDHDKIYEDRCKAILQDEVPVLRVVCSQDIGPTGFLERENATILNASILRTGHRVKKGFRRAMYRLKLACPLYLSQNDGTLIDADAAADYPIKTFASGPTNSMTGAAFLAGLDMDRKVRPFVNGVESRSDEVSVEHSRGEVEPQVLVVDIGGTTTDVCALLPSGFPRQAPGFVEVAGVRTAFTIPEVVSVGLGGGSKVVAPLEFANPVSIGPGSVGHSILSESRVFGGPTLTATDIIVAQGKANLGDANLVRDIPRHILDSAQAEIDKTLERVIDKMKVSTAPVHVILVGGGAIIASDELAGVDKCIKPIHQGAANAIGAAIGKIAGEIDVIEILDREDEKAVIAAACQRAIDLAVARGASPEDVKIVEVNKMPLQYMSKATIRIQIRAVGKPAISDKFSPLSFPSLPGEFGDEVDEAEGEKISISNPLHPTTKPSLEVDLATYRPDVRDGTWYVSAVDLDLISTGCSILGTGGGGPTYYEFLKGLQSLKACEKDRMRIISRKSLKDDAIVCLGSWYGSPSVLNERIGSGTEIIDAIKAVNKIKGVTSFDGVLADEIGGGNGLSALPVGAHFNVPVIDCDGMGRAYPTMYHVIFGIYGHEICPAIITDARGNAVVALDTDTPERLEAILRTAAIELGLSCGSGSNPISGAMVKSATIPNTMSQCWYLGRAVHQARRAKTSYTDAIFNICAGRLLFAGKIVNVQRNLRGGYTMGSVILAPIEDDEKEYRARSSEQGARYMIIPFQNEYLYAALCDSAGTEESIEMLCTVPDLISILGQDGDAIGSQDLRYGLRVSVIAFPAHPLWKTEKAMAVGGPKGFGLKMAPVHVGETYTEPTSVIEEYGS